MKNVQLSKELLHPASPHAIMFSQVGNFPYTMGKILYIYNIYALTNHYHLRYCHLGLIKQGDLFNEPPKRYDNNGSTQLCTYYMHLDSKPHSLWHFSGSMILGGNSF